MLARREHTRFELARKLAPYAQNPLEIEALLEHFSARGWLSETRVVDEIVHARCGRYGPARIRQVLAQRGVPEELIERAVVQLKAGELDTAGAVWARKFRSPPTSPTERARQVRFLQSRGFSFDIAMRIVRAVSRADAALDGD
jgi:regulatory protein